MNASLSPRLLSVPRPHPRRCHGFPLLSGSGTALQALLRSRCRLLPAPARGVDAGKECAGLELWQGAECSPPGTHPNVLGLQLLHVAQEKVN